MKVKTKLAAAFIALSTAASSATIAGPAQAAPKVTVTVKCQKVENKGGAAVGYIYGTGSGSNVGEALKNAKKNVQVPAGYYKRHCAPK